MRGVLAPRCVKRLSATLFRRDVSERVCVCVLYSLREKIKAIGCEA